MGSCVSHPAAPTMLPLALLLRPGTLGFGVLGAGGIASSTMPAVGGRRGKAMRVGVWTSHLHACLGQEEQGSWVECTGGQGSGRQSEGGQLEWKKYEQC